MPVNPAFAFGFPVLGAPSGAAPPPSNPETPPAPSSGNAVQSNSSPAFSVLAAPGAPTPSGPLPLTGPGGNMSTQVWANGTGGNNPNEVDRARYADAAPYSGLVDPPVLGTAARYDVPQPGQDAGPDQLVRGDDPRLGTSSVPGVIGHDGLTGPQGPAGLPGASAFQVAQANGYIGNQAQWLASLQGPQGVQGLQGPAGVSNVPGPQGPPGVRGSRFLGTYDNMGQALTAGVAFPDGTFIAVGDTFFLANGQIYQVN